MNKKRWEMASWITILFFPLAFLNFKVEAYAQYYKTINKDGTISFSDNPTSSILQRNPTQKTIESQEELETISSPYPGKIPDKESSPSLLQKATEEALNPDLMRLSLPGKNWALEFSFKDFQIENSQILADFKGRRIMATNNRTNVILSVYLTPAKKPLGHKELRDSSWEHLKRLPFEREDVKKYEAGQWAIIEYIIKDIKELKNFNQKNVFAYLVKDDTWIDFHLSKVLYIPADENLFKEFVASAKILDKYTPSSMDNFGYGSYYYLNKKYGKAVVYYEKALEQEKHKPRLQNKFWIVLVDNLGMAYALSGNLKMAEKTFQYGVSQEPAYPLFYYNLACTYAELNELDRSLLNLAKAGQYRCNMIAGEKWPDPTKDPSFQRFLNNKKFIEAANKFSR